MLLVGSANARLGIDAAWGILAAGGSALDAVEAAVRLVEDDPSDHTVGYGGYPNLLGEVELDASIMEGTTRRAGAVGALKGYRYAITVARAVLERLPHVLIAGDGAARLAEELGMEREDLLTAEAEETWREGVDGRLPDDPVARRMLDRVARIATDPQRAGGTVDVIARDAAGRLASGVSTSGFAWKYPGRLGDSCVIGAGNYADDRYGAAACTGWGELSIRSSTARSVVDALGRGVPVPQACGDALRELAQLGIPPADIRMHIVAVDAHGGHGGASTHGEPYAYRAPGMAAAELAPRAEIVLS